MSIINKLKAVADIITPPAGYKTLFIRSDTGVPALKDSDGNVSDLVIGGDASGVTYTPADSLDWSDSTDPGNVDDALDDLAARARALENDLAIPYDASQITYDPADTSVWTDSEDPGNVSHALDDVASRVNAIEQAPPPDAADVTYTPADATKWTASTDPGEANEAFDQLASRINTLENLAPVDVQAGNYLISGGGVTWDGGYDYTVSAASYVIGGTEYSSSETVLALSAADATFDRIDVIVVNTSGVVVVVEGTPASNPAKPELAEDELELSFVFVAAASVAAEVTEEVVYKENAEWTAVASDGSIVVNDATTPYEGSVVINATSAAAGDSVTFTDGGLNTLGNYSALTLKIQSKASWPSNKRLNFQWRNGSTLLGTAVSLRTGFYGFNSATTGSYQAISIPMADFGIGVSQGDVLFMSVSGGGGNIGFLLDNIVLQAGTSTGGTEAEPAMLFRGAWSAATSYDVQDVVTSGGQAYVCILANTNQAPPNATYWTALPADASNVSYTPAHSIHWTDSEDPGNVDTALDDLAARTQALEENVYLPAPNVQSVVSAATVTPTFADDAVKITAQAAALALANPTGTAVDMHGMVIRIKDDGTARAITYGSQYRAIGITLPTTTTISKTTYIAMIYNVEAAKWDCIATGTEA